MSQRFMTWSWRYWCLCSSPLLFFWLGFHSFPGSPPFFLFVICASAGRMAQGPCISWPTKGLQTLPRLPPGELEDMCGMCSTGRVPAHPGKFIRRQGCGCGEGKAPVWVYNWDDTPIGCIINKQKRGCWMTSCLKRGRGFSGFVSGHRARRVN